MDRHPPLSRPQTARTLEQLPLPWKTEGTALPETGFDLKEANNATFKD
jgi:hypothetical protein